MLATGLQDFSVLGPQLNVLDHTATWVYKRFNFLYAFLIHLQILQDCHSNLQDWFRILFLEAGPPHTLRKPGSQICVGSVLRNCDISFNKLPKSSIVSPV